jgi:hypothetical protein
VLPWLEGVSGRGDPPTVYNLSPTCRSNTMGFEMPPCGAAADYLAIIQNVRADSTSYLATVSVCARHARELPVY